MKAFVLNLKRAKQRRTFMKTQLERLGLDYEFVLGTDYRDMADEDFRRLCSAKATSGNNYLKGVFAASLSHLAIYRAIANQDLSHALVLEDDVILPKAVNRILDDISRVQKSDTIILLRYYSHRKEPLKITRENAISLPSGGELLSPVEIEAVASAAAYVLPKKVAQLMLEQLLPVDHVPDKWSLFYNRKVFSELRCLFPQVVTDAPFVPIVEYAATRTPTARLKAAIRKIWGVNEFVGCLKRSSRSRSEKPQFLLSLTDDSPFWSRPSSLVEEHRGEERSCQNQDTI